MNVMRVAKSIWSECNTYQKITIGCNIFACSLILFYFALVIAVIQAEVITLTDTVEEFGPLIADIMSFNFSSHMAREYREKIIKDYNLRVNVVNLVNIFQNCFYVIGNPLSAFVALVLFVLRTLSFFFSGFLQSLFYPIWMNSCLILPLRWWFGLNVGYRHLLNIILEYWAYKNKSEIITKLRECKLRLIVFVLETKAKCLKKLIEECKKYVKVEIEINSSDKKRSNKE